MNTLIHLHSTQAKTYISFGRERERERERERRWTYCIFEREGGPGVGGWGDFY